MKFKIDSNEVKNIKIEKLEIYNENEEENKIKKSLSEEIRYFLKNEIFWGVIPTIYGGLYFLINGYYKIIMGKNFNLPSEYFRINLSEIITYLSILILFPLLFFIVSRYLKKDKLRSKLLELALILLLLYVELSFSYILGYLWILIFTTIFFIYIVLFLISFKTKNIIINGIYYSIYIIYFIIYIISVYYYFNNISKEYEIISKDSNPKVVITTYENKYLIMDCDIDDVKKELAIYTKKYEFIDIDEAKEISFMNFEKIYRIGINSPLKTFKISEIVKNNIKKIGNCSKDINKRIKKIVFFYNI